MAPISGQLQRKKDGGLPETADPPAGHDRFD
jgi:hypothetical protein